MSKTVRRRACRILATGLLAMGLLPAIAGADGDPASDVLLGQNAFYPYQPPVSASLQKTLDQQTAAAAKAKFPIKIALIASPVDLGIVPSLFGKPQQYAQFLDQEISFRAKQPLLVVMPAGFGSEGLPAQATAAISSLKKPAGGKSDDLAQAAIAAVPKLASAAGHPLKGAAGSGGGGSSTAVILVLLVVAAVATVVALIAGRQRQAPAE
jgi:hypothetical protein